MCNSSLSLRLSLCHGDLGILCPLPENIAFLPRPSGLQALILHSAPTLKLDPRLPQSFKGDVPSSVRTSKRDVYLAKDAVGSASGTDGIDAKYRTNGDGSGSLVPEYGIGVAETASRCGEQNVSRF